MNISDLNYLETLNQEPNIIGGTFYGGKYKYYFDKDIDVDVDLDLDFDVDVDVDKDLDVDADVKSTVDVDGNSASLAFDVEAVGFDTFAEADVFVLTTSKLSAVGGLLVAATD